MPSKRLQVSFGFFVLAIGVTYLGLDRRIERLKYFPAASILASVSCLLVKDDVF